MTKMKSMSLAPNILAFAATHREGSSNVQLLLHVAQLAQAEGAAVCTHPFAEFSMPVFAEDMPTRETLPEGGKRFLAALEAADGLMIASPEYNWSFPAALKNLIDWISCLRPNPFAGKPVLLLSASPSRRGGLQGLLQLRAPLESLQMHIYPRYFALGEANLALANVNNLAKEKALTPVSLEEELSDVVQGFVRFARHHMHPDFRK